MHTNACINILRCFGYPREHNFGLVLILSPTGCTEGCVYFPQSCRNTHLPHFLDCLLNTTLIPCLLVCFLSILHERVCDYSGVQSSATGILRMGDMNIHITWLTHVRTGPKKKKIATGCLRQHYAPYGNELEWQYKLQTRGQESSWPTLKELCAYSPTRPILLGPSNSGRKFYEGNSSREFVPRQCSFG